MSIDHLHEVEGSMAESPKVCGGVDMEREKSMMKKSMNSMLRVALVGVMAMVLGLTGLATSAQAVTYYVAPGTATAVGVDGDTDYTADRPTNKPTKVLLAAAAANTGFSMRPARGAALAWETLIRGYSPVYATSRNITGITGTSFDIRGYGTDDAFRFNIYSYDPAGALWNKTLLLTSSVLLDEDGATSNVSPTYTGSGTVPAGHRVLLEIDFYHGNNSTSVPRIYNTNATFTTTETPAAPPTQSTYYYQIDNGTTVAGMTTETEQNCSTAGNTALTTYPDIALGTTATFGCVDNRYLDANVGVTQYILKDTTYTEPTTVTGIGTTPLVFRSNGGTCEVQVNLGYVLGGTFTSLGSSAPQTVAATAWTERNFDISSITGDAPTGSALALEYEIVTNADPDCRFGFGSDAGGIGVDSGNFTVDEVAAPCTPDATPVISGSVNGDPIDICSVVADGTNTTTNYKVTEGGGTADVDPNGTYIDAENNTQIINDTAATPALAYATGAAGANGTGYLETTSGVGSNDPTGQRADYPVNFTTAGTYYFWVRIQESGGGNSVFVGVDGVKAGGLTQAADAGQWYWTNALQTGTGVNTAVVSAGAHTINLWGREDSLIDGVYLSTSNATPPGLGGAGPNNYTGTIPTGATVIDPTNTSSTLYDGAGCSVPTGTWTDGSQDIEITYTDNCGATGQTTTGNFTFTSCTDTDLATLTTSDPGTASDTITIQTAVGVEAEPADLAAMVATMSIDIAGAGACNVTGGSMTLNGANMEYVWDTSACGTGSVVNGITIDVSGTDPDCGTTVNAAQVAGVSIDNMCSDVGTVVIDNLSASEPFTGTVSVTASVDSGDTVAATIRVADTDPPGAGDTSPFSYTPPASSEGSVTFYATATGPAACGAYTASATYNYDTLLPTVTSTVPVDGADPVAKDTSVTINFSENIDCATVDTSSVTMSPAPATSWTRASCSGSTAVFAPVGQANSTLYVVSIANTVADLAGNTMIADSISYTTECTDSVASSISFNGTNTASGDFSGASMVTPVDLSNLEYRVTESSAPVPANWGDTTSAGHTDAMVNFARAMGWTSPNVDGMVLKSVSVYIGAAHPSQFRVGIYEGGTTTDPSGSTLLCDAGQTTGSATSQYVTLTCADTAITKNSPLWIVVKGNDNNTPVAWTQTTADAGDLGASPGRFESASLNIDETVAYPGAWPAGDGGSASNYWYAMYLTYETGGAGETTLYDWNSDPQLAMSGEAPSNNPLVNGNTYTLYARGDDAECGATKYYVGGGGLPGTSQSFTWTSCTDLPASTITVSGGPVAGSVDVNTLFGSTQNVASFFYRIDGGAPIAIGTPWDSTSVVGSDVAPVDVTVTVEGTDPDCGGQLISHSATISVDNVCTDLPASTITVSGGPVGGSVDVNTLFSSTQNVASFFYHIDGGAPIAIGTPWDSTAIAGSDTVPVDVTVTVEGTDPDCGGSAVSDSATISVDNTCATSAQISITSTPAAINSVGGTSTITINEDATPVRGGTDEWSSNGGSSWNASGTTFNPGAQAQGTATIMGQAIDDTCGTAVTATNITVDYDTRTNNLVVLGASASLQGINSVLITMPYQGDKDGNATFQYQYQENTGGFGAWTAPVTDADNTSPKTFTISGLTLDALVDINVRYIDTGIDHNGNADPQPLQVQLVSWVDSNLLHNSNRFACSEIGFFSDEAACVGAGGIWTYDKKHTVAGNVSEWGTSATGDVTGPILCNTCHKAGSGNIKRITDMVSFSTGTPPNGGGAVSATIAVPGTSSDYGDDSVAHNPSTKICEVCHSQNQFHNSDRAQNSGGNVHQNNNDCIDCHLHTGGFRASCAACHGNPPVDAGTLATSTPTNSATAGAHDAHFNTLSIGCEVCHYNSVGGGSTHDTGGVTIGFVGLPDPLASAAMKLDGGSYDGQSAVNGYDTTDAGGLTTTVTTGNALTCANYCHGSTVGGTSPAWNAVAPTMCGTCHGDDAASASTLPSGTSHNTHANAQGLACTDCHGSDAGGSGHLDGEVVWDLAGLPGTTETYRASANGQTGAVAPSGSYGTCSNVSCHNNVDTLTWDNGPASCTTCHAAPPNTNAHAAHYTAKGWSGDASCDNCHPDNTGGHSDVTDSTILVDAALEWNSSTCFGSGGSVAGCHNGNTSPAWNAGTITCTNCHTVGGTNSVTVANPETGLHGNAAAGVQDHDNTLSGGCGACHVKANISQHWNGVASATPSYTEAQSGVNSLSGGSYVDNAGTGANRGTCTTDCHTDNGNWSRQWSTDADSTSTVVGNARCDVCHGQWTTWAVGTTHYKAGGTDSASNSRGSGHDCTNCHAYTTARHDNNAINVNNNGATPGRTNNTYGSGTAGCGACHGNQTDSGKNFPISYFSETYVAGSTAMFGPACSSCHDTAVAAGKGAPAVDSTSSHVSVTTGAGLVQCEDCHSGHSTGVVIPNNITVGIDYSTTGHTGIGLGGTGTATNINGVGTADIDNKTTEAEICWTCHDAQSTKISEWGTDTGANNNSDPGNNYNYGTLNQPNWIGAIWTSGVVKFGYKTSGIQSTHAANLSGVSGVDAVANIRCSYCHDVHDLNNEAQDSISGQPYLRGTWLGNPFPEDGAPQANDSWSTGNYGAVPRGNANSNELGGFQIEQNNTNAMTGFTVANSSSLCEMCHGDGNGTFSTAEIDGLNQFGTASTDWVGTNGHSASTLGGGESAATNIFTTTDRNSNAVTGTGDGSSAGNPAMGYMHLNSGSEAYGFRSSADENDGWNLAPRIVTDRIRTNIWGVNVLTGLDSNYHNFSCSKCHNPHASRLPRLMITNCLDTSHNTWDDWASVDSIPGTGTSNNDGGATPSADNANKTFSQATSAQNCHRVGDTGRGAGWNNVTPW